MIIRHYYDCAGVAGILSRYQTRMGHDSKVMTTDKGDPWHITSFYNGYIMPENKFYDYETAMRFMYHADVIHIHFQKKIARQVRDMFPSKKIFFHWHGTDARRATKEEIENVRQATDGMFIATADLFDKVPDAQLIPTPIDTDLFSNKGVGNGDFQIIRSMFDYDMIIDKL